MVRETVQEQRGFRAFQPSTQEDKVPMISQSTSRPKRPTKDGTQRANQGSGDTAPSYRAFDEVIEQHAKQPIVIDDSPRAR
ncbi:hypothetical protein E4U24_007137 [Claviceps purpurea]|nr:hypothetical protein E4U27_000880 [Claviceps purpurea]KAG6238471.1 hypothetical protein E4U24_007137 [Claviceps purpurea]